MAPAQSHFWGHGTSQTTPGDTASSPPNKTTIGDTAQILQRRDFDRCCKCFGLRFEPCFSTRLNQHGDVTPQTSATPHTESQPETQRALRSLCCKIQPDRWSLFNLGRLGEQLARPLLDVKPATGLFATSLIDVLR